MEETEKTVWLFEAVDKTGRAFGGIDNKFDKLNRKFGTLDKRDPFAGVARNSKKSIGSLKNNVGMLAGEFPMLGRAAALATSPLGIAVATVAGAGLVFNKATNESKKFNHEFLELKNLNLDKSNAQLDTLKGNILDLSGRKGFDPSAISKGFFDIQSATGKYGDEVETIVEKTALFARATKADLGSSIAGVGKAMGVFGFGSDQIEQFLISSKKAEQVGVTTLNQLSQVQVEYIGAAAAAGQSFDAANKLFALNTKSTKNADIGATYTKGFFEDLAKLDKVGIDVFGKDGSFREVDKILLDVDNKFKQLSNDDAINKFITKIGGNEGLRGVLKQVATNGNEVFRTFKEYDKLDIKLGDILKNVNIDLESQEKLVAGKLTTAWVKLGDKLEPISRSINNIKIDLADAFINGLDGNFNPNKVYNNALNKERREGEPLESANITGFKNFAKDKFPDNPEKQQLELNKLLNNRKSALIADAFKLDDKINSIGFLNKFHRYDEVKKLGQDRLKIDGQINAINKAIGAGIGKQNKNGLPPPPPTGTPEPDKTNTRTTSLTGSETVTKRNITVNIDKLVETINVATQGQDLSETQVEDMVTRALVRAVRDFEQSV